MKKTLFFLAFLFFCTTLQAQSAIPDTIITRGLDTILCTITKTDSNTIYYTTLDLKLKNIERAKVFSYVEQRFYVPPVPKPPKPIPIVVEERKQILDSVMMSQEIDYMKTCFTNYHKAYNQGAAVSVIGLTLATTSGILLANKTETKLEYAMLGLGGVTSAVGMIIIIDSHKWMGRAGLGITGNGVGVRYIFK
jgi:hypothetical protein